MSVRVLSSLGSLAAAAAAAAALGALGGCMLSDAPPASSDPVGTITPPPAPTVEVDAGADAAGELCPPRTKRECMTTFVTAGQVRDCRFSFEWCKADGSGWHPCGKQGKDANGVAIAPD